jgi:RNA polymerase sigma-70 factor (ECF subfamily)
MKTAKASKTRNRKARKPAAQRENRKRREIPKKDRLFEELFNTYRGRVYFVARRYTHNEDDALDLVQDVFIKAYRALDSLADDTHYGPWIYRIAVNHCIDHIRKKRLPEFSYDEFVENGGVLAEPTAAPSEDVAGIELRDQVLGLVNSLSPDHRAVLLLHCMENLPYRQIARVLNCSIGTIMSRLHYARKYLRQAMQLRAVV